VGTKELLQSHVFGVEQRTVEHDDATFERDVVTHLGAVAILAINERDEIGMIRQYRSHSTDSVGRCPPVRSTCPARTR